MTTPRTARALPLRADGVRTIPDTCTVALHGTPTAGQILPVDAPAGALPPAAAFAIRYVSDDGTPRRVLCVVDEVHAGHDGTERCTLRLVAAPAPATGRAHERTLAAMELIARRVEAGGQRVPILVVDVGPGGLGIASFIELRAGEFLRIDLPDGASRLLAQVVRVGRTADMWAYGLAFGDLERAEPLVRALLLAAQREAA